MSNTKLKPKVDKPRLITNDQLSYTETVAANKLRCFAWGAPIPKMLKTTELKIINFVPERLRKKYPKIVSDYMTEVHEEYDRLVKVYSYQKVIRPEEGDFVPERDKFRFKLLGKTERYHIYLKNRSRIKKIFISPYPFMRAIVHYAHRDFPEFMNDYGKYRPRGEITIIDLRDNANNDLQLNTLFLKGQWYPKIIKLMFKYYRKQIPPRRTWARVMNAATALINLQINAWKMRTLDHMNEIILNKHRIPYLKLIAVCDADLDLFPNVHEISNLYHRFVDNILAIGKGMEPIEFFIDPQKFPPKSKLLKIEIGNVYPIEAHAQLQDSIDEAYTPISNYLKDFQETFHPLYSPTARAELKELSLIDPPLAFDDYLEHIEKISNMIEKVKLLVQKEFFDIATVYQTDAINSMRTIGNQSIALLAQVILKAHIMENRIICQEFDYIKAYVMKVPLSTEELMKTGEYILYVKGVFGEQLRARIQETLRVSDVNIIF